jgi:D-inositol-3-phosphate glycosyltransferase
MIKTIKIIGPAYPYRGGIATGNERLAQEFASMGLDVGIETFTVQYPSFLFPGKTQYSGKPAPENLSIERTINSLNPFNWLKVGRRIRKEKPDLVVIRYWLPIFSPLSWYDCWHDSKEQTYHCYMSGRQYRSP